MLKTILSFCFALIIVALISLGVTIFSLSGYEGLNASLAWETFISFLYATVHKLGFVAIASAFIFYLLPKHLPRLPLVVAISVPLAILYNYALLAWTQEGLLLKQLYASGMTKMDVISNFLVYYGIYAALMSFIGGIISHRLTRQHSSN